MTRRSFVTLLATLVSWVTVRPNLHADAINGSFKTPIEPDPPFSGHRMLKLWDGDTFLKEVISFRREGRAVVVPWRRPTNGPVVTDPGPGIPTHETVFRLEQIAGCPDNNYQYESGPKWWVPFSVAGLWDGEFCVSQFPVHADQARTDYVVTVSPAWGRRGFAFAPQASDSINVTTFRQTLMFVDQVGTDTPRTVVHYEYLRGPKFWEPVALYGLPYHEDMLHTGPWQGLDRSAWK